MKRTLGGACAALLLASCASSPSGGSCRTNSDCATNVCYQGRCEGRLLGGASTGMASSGGESTGGSGGAASTGGSTGGASTGLGGSSGGSSSSGGASTGSGGTAAGGSSSGGVASTGGSGGSGGTGTTGGSSSGAGAPPLVFAFTGDTRPSSADDVANYPTSIVDQIVSSMSTKGVAFALDTGDHVKIGKSDTTAQAQSYAQQMLQLYGGATATLGAPWYPTMGNHECWNNKALCDVTDPVLSVFMTFVQQTVQTQEPYYTFDVATPSGTATFVIVADTAWDSTESAWLDQALTHGDGSAYTIVAKHVPSSNTTDFPTNADEMTVIEAHKFALLVDSHAHLYSHAGENGREVTLGLGGAPLSNPSVDNYGYGLVQQQSDGTLTVTEWDAIDEVAKDSFSVGPNQ